MFNCCGTNGKDMCGQFDCNVKETKEGIQIEVKPKDPAKIDSLKALVKACKDFGCEC